MLEICGNHSFIISLKYAFQNDYRLYLILEYAPGGNLKNQIESNKKKGFTEDISRLYLAEIICAIEYLHSLNIIYRDIKPGNIVLDKNGHCKLTDFGLSKENIGDLSVNKSYIGSISYMAPEVLREEPHNKTLDWYLCGVLLYELLHGLPPYFNENRNILYNNISTNHSQLASFQ